MPHRNICDSKTAAGMENEDVILNYITHNSNNKMKQNEVP